MGDIAKENADVKDTKTELTGLKAEVVKKVAEKVNKESEKSIGFLSSFLVKDMSKFVEDVAKGNLTNKFLLWLGGDAILGKEMKALVEKVEGINEKSDAELNALLKEVSGEQTSKPTDAKTEDIGKTQNITSPAKVETQKDAGEIKIDDIKSAPFEKGASGVTLCSKTAFDNAKTLFGTDLPRGNAVDVLNAYKANPTKPDSFHKDCIQISENFDTIPAEAVYCDILCDTVQVYDQDYEHRAIGIISRNEKGEAEVFVLDPYAMGLGNTVNPIPLEDYKTKGGLQIAQVAFYKSDKKVAGPTVE